MLGEVPAERLDELAADAAYTRRVDAAAADLRDYLTRPRWFQPGQSGPRGIAYFSMEFGVTEVLPNYSGGLGILAGDHLKAASDLDYRSSASDCCIAPDISAIAHRGWLAGRTLSGTRSAGPAPAAAHRRWRTGADSRGHARGAGAAGAGVDRTGRANSLAALGLRYRRQ